MAAMAGPTLTVLGIDALDADIAKRTGSFDLEYTGTAGLPIDENDHPWTPELWSCIITGSSPEKLNINSNTNPPREWSNEALKSASQIARKVLPKSSRKKLGRLLQNVGATYESNAAKRGGHDTLFDGGIRAHPIEVPGWNESGGSADITYKLGHNDDAEVALDAIESEFDQRSGALKSQLDVPHDLLFVHIYALDAISHGWWDRQDVVEEWYEKVEEEVLVPALEHSDDVFVCSDHGFHTDPETERGEHTHTSYWASTFEPSSSPESITEYRGIIEDQLRSARSERAEQESYMDDLGYI